MARLLLAALFLFSAWICSNAIYEDQVGLLDWHQQYIGRVNYASFQTQGSGRKRVVVATDKNVVASLNLRTGEIFWRRALEDLEPIDGLETVLGKYAISISRGGQLRAWHLPDGSLIWETLLRSKSTSPVQLLALPVDINKDRSNDLVVLTDQNVYAVSSTDGAILWTSDLDSSLSGASMNYDGESLFLVGVRDSSPVVCRLDPVTGSVHHLSLKSAFRGLSVSEVMITGGAVVGLDTEGRTIVSGGILENEVVLEQTSISELIASPSKATRIVRAKVNGGFAVSTGNELYIIGMADSKLRVTKHFQGPASLSDGIPLEETVSGVVQHLDSGARIRVFASDHWTEIVDETVDLGAHRGLVQKLFLNPYTRTDRSRGYRVLVVGEDDSLALLQQGKVVWLREEALASVVDTTTAELPLEKAGVSVAEVEHSLAEWLKGHMLRLKSTLMLANADELAALQSLRLNSAEKTKLVRDENGFRKLIIVLTSCGKLFALHTGDGRVVWSLLLPLFKRSSGSSFTSLKLFPWKIPHHHALDENPVVLILGTSEHGNGILSWVDMHTGKEELAFQLPYPVMQAIPLPFTDSSERRLHLFVEKNAKTHLFPATEESLAIFRKHSQDVFFYWVDKEGGLMEGFSITDQLDVDSKLQQEGYTFTSSKVWSLVFPSESEAITTVTSGRLDEVVHTHAKVLASRDVMYKYLSKNMIFVATVTPREKSLMGAANPDETWLVAYLIDAITGQILHRVSHAGAQGPVHAVLCENWVVYNYFNVHNHRVEMSVLEVYDKSADGKDVLQLILGRYNASIPFSSFTHRALEVKSQSYFFSSTVKAMTVTTTAKGITGKQLLVGTVGNQIIALDKRLLDPRRSLSPTPAEREEGIIALNEGLPVFPQSYISHSARVEGLRSILSIPARLESTCLVFAHGIDMFFTRTAPSRTYDSLTEDFSYALLLITIVVLLVAIVVSWVLSERKDLKDKWS